MPGQRGSEKRQLDASILVRLEAFEKARLAELAEAEGLTLAAYARLLLAGGTAAPSRAQTLVAANLNLVRELRRLGGEVRPLLLTRDHAQQGRRTLDAIVAAIAHLAAAR